MWQSLRTAYEFPMPINAQVPTVDAVSLRHVCVSMVTFLLTWFHLLMILSGQGGLQVVWAEAAGGRVIL